jgi:hypothetical protein
MAELSSQQRKNLKPSEFALPPDDYPIPDRQHAIDALARVDANGTPAEKATVRRNVCKSYPDLPYCQSPGMKVDVAMNGGKS